LYAKYFFLFKIQKNTYFFLAILLIPKTAIPSPANLNQAFSTMFPTKNQ